MNTRNRPARRTRSALADELIFAYLLLAVSAILAIVVNVASALAA